MKIVLRATTSGKVAHAGGLMRHSQYPLSNAAAMLGLIVIVTLSAAAQSSPHPPDLFHANTRSVVLDIFVTDDTGQPVAGLTQDVSSIREAGVPQQIRSFQAVTDGKGHFQANVIVAPASQAGGKPWKPAVMTALEVSASGVASTPPRQMAHVEFAVPYRDLPSSKAERWRVVLQDEATRRIGSSEIKLK
jgi:hypothetical protein